MEWPAQVSGDGWVADKPVSGLDKTPILGQKQLRGKTVKKPIMASSIKRALGGEQRTREIKTREKEVRKGVKDKREKKET